MAERVRAHSILAVAAALLGVLAAVAGDPYPAGRGDSTEPEVAVVSALDLARWLRDGRQGVHLLDVRSERQFLAYHIPGAKRLSASELSRRDWDRTDTLVVYAEGDAAARRAVRVLRGRGLDARVLRGGLLDWIDQIAEPRLPALPPTATASELAARRDQLELSRYFGGMPVVSPAASTPAPAAADPVGSRRSEAAAVARILRRGC